MSEPNVVKGSCLCKAVSLSTTNVNNEVGACHCRMCRKWGGSSFLAIECGSELNFTGEEHITVYQSSEWAERGFCKLCGSHLFYKLKLNNHYYVPVGIFDNREELVFDHQIFIDEKPAYYSFANETKKMTGAEVIAMFASSDDATGS